MLEIWTTFRDLLDFLEHGPKMSASISCARQYRKRAQEWGNLLRDVYTRDVIRIYPHILIAHGADIYETHGPLNVLANQAFESRHKYDRTLYYKHSTHGGKVSRARVPVNVHRTLLVSGYRRMKAAKVFMTDKQVEERSEKDAAVEMCQCELC